MTIIRAPGDRGRGALAVGAAALVHVSVFLALLAHDVEPWLVVPAPPDEPFVAELAVETMWDALDDHAPVGVAAAHETSALGGAPAHRPEASRRASSSSDGANGADVADVAGTEAPPPVGSGAPVALFTTPPAAIGLAGDGPNPFVGSGGPETSSGSQSSRTAAPDAPTSAEAKRRVEHSLKSAMRARDVDIGLGPEGPVVRALEDATYGGLGPERGNAMFLAVVDGNGLVVDVRLLSSTGGGDWNDVRRRATRALAGKKIELRGAKGAELRIHVDSDVRLPSGNKPDERVRPTLSDGKVALPGNVPSGGTADVVKTYTVGTFDVTDIGAKPRRIVHARLVSMTTL